MILGREGGGSILTIDIVDVYPFRVGVLMGSTLIANMVGGWIAWRVLQNISIKNV